MPRWIALYFSDLRTLATNPALLVIVTGLSVLPSLYAWFNIGASWDPYGNTQGVRIAVANEDRGADMLGKPVHMGEEIVASLKSNDKFGWTFTDAKDALDGVRSGNYYASITIPENFSARIASVVTDTPRQAELIYDVNEKINAIAPKMTGSGASGVMLSVSRSFVQTANGAIFKLFNELGIKLQQELPSLQKLEALMFRLEDNLPQIEAAVNASTSDIARMQHIVGVAQQKLPEAERIAKEGGKLAQNASDFLQRSDEALSQLSPRIGSDLAALAQAAASVAAIAEQLPIGGSGIAAGGKGGAEAEGDSGAGVSGGEASGSGGAGVSGGETSGSGGAGVSEGETSGSGGARVSEGEASGSGGTGVSEGETSGSGGAGVSGGEASGSGGAGVSGSGGAGVSGGEASGSSGAGVSGGEASGSGGAGVSGGEGSGSGGASASGGENGMGANGAAADGTGNAADSASAAAAAGNSRALAAARADAAALARMR
ncbi:YhgE/Pip N-terminal domain protein, partial [Paenibacillus curdlanolyticus YK9]